MAKTILLIDDSEDIRELVTFVTSEVGEFLYLQAHNVAEAKKILQQRPPIDLIVCDFKMPDGTGDQIYELYKNLAYRCPFLFLSGELLENHNLVRENRIPFIKKPFSVSDLQDILLNLLGSPAKKPKYIPVSLRLLELIYEVKTALLVKINDSKFVEITAQESTFDKDQLKRFYDKGLTHLYINQSDAESFISEYRKKTLSLMAWNEIDLANVPDRLIIQTEFLKKFSDELGIREDLAIAAADNIQRVLDIASRTHQLSSLLRQFSKIERWGSSDHSCLLAMICESLVERMSLKNSSARRGLAFASLIHDLPLTDDEYDAKRKNLKKLKADPKSTSADLKKLRQHPALAAEICRKWDYCPIETTQIILQHHETPDGSGFPLGKKAHEIHPLSAIFIVAADFTDHYMETFGAFDLDYFFSSRSSLYNLAPFQAPFEALKQTLNQSEKAS